LIEKIVRISYLGNILPGFADLIHTAADCGFIENFSWDCGFSLQFSLDPDLVDSNLDKTIVGSRILLQIWADRRNLQTVLPSTQCFNNNMW
jgi:hypothetical protein